MDKDEKAEQRKEIGKRLAIARKARKKTQEEVAAMLGKQQTDLSKFENGLGAPLEIYIGFAEKLHISLDWLLTGKGTMENGRKEKTLEEMTVKDVGTALAALATVSIIKASQKIPKFGTPSINGINAEIVPFYVNVLDETSRLIQRAANCFCVSANSGINAEIVPRKYSYVGGTGHFSIVTNPLKVDTLSETSKLIQCDANYTVEDRRGVILCDFLTRLSDLQDWLSKDDHISRGEETFNKNLAVLLESLPNLPMSPLPATINQRENVSLNNPQDEKYRLFYRI